MMYIWICYLLFMFLLFIIPGADISHKQGAYMKHCAHVSWLFVVVCVCNLVTHLVFQVWTFCTSRVFLGNVMYMWVDYSLLFAFVFLLFGIRGVGILLWLDIPGEYMSVNCLLFVFAFLLFSIFEVLYTCGLIIIHCCLCLYSYIYYSKCGHFTQLGS